MQNFKFKPEAEARARHALDLDEKDFRATILLAEAVDPAEGIQLLQDTAKTLEVDTKFTANDFNRKELARLLHTLGMLHWRQEQYDQTVTVCLRALTFDITDYYRVFSVFQIYARKHRWEDMIDALEVIRQHSTEEHNLGEMLQTFAEVPDIHALFHGLVRRTERIDLVGAIYEAAISRLDNTEAYSQLSNIRCAYGETLYGIRDRRAEAIKQWEQAIQQDLPRGNDHHILQDLISKLAPIYVDRARREDDPTAHLEQLRSLVPDSVSDTASFVDPQIYLARYWYSRGNHVEAKQMVREILQQAIDLLSDEDVGNDAFAFQRLISVFVPLGDQKNTDVCVRMLARIGGMIMCDGDCGESWNFGDAMWWCRDCVNVNFNGACYQKLCRGEFNFTACHRGHEFFYMKVDEEMAKGEDPKTAGFDQNWIEGIRREYLVAQD